MCYFVCAVLKHQIQGGLVNMQCSMVLFMSRLTAVHAAGYNMTLIPVDSPSYMFGSLVPSPIIFWQYGYEFTFIAIGVVLAVAGGIVITMAVHCCNCWPCWVAKLPFRIIHLTIVTIYGIIASLVFKPHDGQYDASVADGDAPGDKQHTNQALTYSEDTAPYITPIIQARADELHLLTNHVLASLLIEFNINAGKPTKELMVFALSRCPIATGTQLKYMRHIARKHKLVIPVLAMTSVNKATQWITLHQ
jgi:hypothetical protein